jgi:hypothetical protein
MTLQEEVGTKMLNSTATKQDILAAEYDWFVVQGKPQCLNHNGVCVYRNEAGDGCAVGIFIPDGQEARNLVGDLEGILAEGNVPEFYVYYGLLEQLQAVHDAWNGKSDDPEFATYMVGWLARMGYKGDNN